MFLWNWMLACGLYHSFIWHFAKCCNNSKMSWQSQFFKRLQHTYTVFAPVSVINWKNVHTHLRVSKTCVWNLSRSYPVIKLNSWGEIFCSLLLHRLLIFFVHVIMQVTITVFWGDAMSSGRYVPCCKGICCLPSKHCYLFATPQGVASQKTINLIFTNMRALYVIICKHFEGNK
jgi:hypothetical protein